MSFMRNWTVVMFLILSISNVLAQKISVDRLEADGKHQIMTKTKEFSIDGTKYEIGVKLYEDTRGKDWLLLVSSYSHISKTAEILLRLEDESTLYLPVNNVHIGKVTLPGYGITIGSITTLTPARDVDYYSAVFVLSEACLQKFDTCGIKKIRFNDGTEYKDRIFEYDSLGRHLAKCYKNILKRLKNPIVKKDLFDEF